MIFTIDVEDWTQSVLNNKNPVTDRVLHNTLRVLDMLDEHGHKATFFILGNVAKKHPKLIRIIAEAGHEVASHGFHHDSIFTLSKEQILEDVSSSVKLLEDTSGQKVLGYRAPDFSIRESLFEWYCEALVSNGLRYDSSLFPMKVFKYGIEKRYSLDIFDKHGINEHYLSYMKFGEQKLPFFGGGYFRLMPYSMTKKLTSQLDSTSAVFYMHPYEVDTDELAYVKSTGQKIPLKWRLSQFIGRDTVEQKIHKLMSDFEFNSFANEYYLEGATSVAQHTLSNIEEGSVVTPQPEVAYEKVSG